MKTTRFVPIALVMTSSIVFARAGTVSLPTKVAESDVIAKVEILSTTEMIPRWEKAEDGRLKLRFLKAGEYRNTAQVKVLQAIKGVSAGEIYTVRFGTDLVCHQVRYEKGGEYLVFHTKLPDEKYTNYNSTYGSYLVKDDAVMAWQPYPNSDQITPWQDVLAEIAQAMK